MRLDGNKFQRCQSALSHYRKRPPAGGSKAQMDCEPFMPDALRDTDSGDPAEFRPHETIRVRAATVGGAARGLVPGSRQDACVAGIAAIFRRDDPAAANPAIQLLTLRWTFPVKRASGAVRRRWNSS